MLDDHATEGTAVPFLHPIRTAFLVGHVVSEFTTNLAVASIREGLKQWDKLNGRGR